MMSTLEYRAALAAIVSLCGCPAQSGTTPTADLGAQPGPPDLRVVCAEPAPDPELPPFGRILQAAPEPLAAGAVYTTAGLPPLPPKLPAGPGKELVESFCVGCHSLRYIAMQPPLSAQQWTKEVDKMVHDYGAVISDEARGQLLTYLQTNFAVAVAPVRP